LDVHAHKTHESKLISRYIFNILSLSKTFNINESISGIKDDKFPIGLLIIGTLPIDLVGYGDDCIGE
jgi:hypothetical protein